MREFVLQLSRPELVNHLSVLDSGTLQVHVGEGRVFHGHSQAMSSGPVLEC